MLIYVPMSIFIELAYLLFSGFFFLWNYKRMMHANSTKKYMK
jgi:hypothetical protein